jgi:Domain of Unknown Function (DUF928)
MKVQLCFAGLCAALLIPFSKGVAQVTPSPTASVTPAASPATSPTAANLPYQPPGAAGNIPARVSAGTRGKSPIPSPATSPTAASTKLFYKPPAASGNIPARVSGGARGEAVDAVLIALVPNHVALTTQSQPSLFWFQSKPAKAKFELTVVEPKNPKPLVSLTAPQADKAGIHRVKLAKYKVELQPDVAYEWSVAIVPDAENRSRDVVAKGVIKRINPPGDLATHVETAGDVERAALYAQAGIWYDAFESVSNAIEAHPDDASLHAQRASLLKQVGLSEAAAFDQKR